MVDKEQESIVINPTTAYITAISALQKATKIAKTNRDGTLLVDVANSWIELGGHLLQADCELYYGDDEEEILSRPVRSIGFSMGEEDDGTKPGA